MIGICQNHLRPRVFELGWRNGFHIGEGAHGHEPRRLNDAVGCHENACSRVGTAAVGLALKRKGLQGNSRGSIDRISILALAFKNDAKSKSSYADVIQPYRRDEVALLCLRQRASTKTGNAPHHQFAHPNWQTTPLPPSLPILRH